MSIAGTWNLTTHTPMGAQKGTLTAQVDGDSLSGTMAGAQGEVAIENGKVDGNSASWSMKVTQPMPITLEFTVEVDGDSLSGNAKLGAFGNAKVEGTRG